MNWLRYLKNKLFLLFAQNYKPHLRPAEQICLVLLFWWLMIFGFTGTAKKQIRLDCQKWTSPLS
jgi:hypothetical protein